jgi:hypothetical protein
MIAPACRAVSIDISKVYKRRKLEPEFNSRIIEAIDIGKMKFEGECFRRAWQGVFKDVYYEGKIVGQELRFSDFLALGILKAKFPEYRAIDVTTKEGKQSPEELAGQIKNMDAEEYARFTRAMAANGSSDDKSD